MALMFRIPTEDLYPEKFQLLKEEEQVMVLCLLAVAGETDDGVLRHIGGLLKVTGGTQENLDVLEAAGYIKRLDDDSYKVIMSSQEGEDE